MRRKFEPPSLWEMMNRDDAVFGWRGAIGLAISYVCMIAVVAVDIYFNGYDPERGEPKKWLALLLNTPAVLCVWYATVCVILWVEHGLKNAVADFKAEREKWKITENSEEQSGGD